MKGGLGNLMKQAQQMQENMKAMQEKLGSIEVEGQSGAGMVKVSMTCRYDVKRVSIDSSLIGDDKEMLEDLIAAAVNDAVRRVESTTQEKMAGFTSGLSFTARDEIAILIFVSDRGESRTDMSGQPAYDVWKWLRYPYRCFAIFHLIENTEQPRRLDQRLTLPARRGSKVGAAHGLPSVTA